MLRNIYLFICLILDYRTATIRRLQKFTLSGHIVSLSLYSFRKRE